MPVVTLDPSAEGFYTDFTNSGGASKAASASDEVDSNFVWRIDNSAGSQSFVVPNLPAHAVDISSVKWNGYPGRSGTPTAKLGALVCSSAGTAVYATGENFANDFPPSWDKANFLNKAVATAPGGGGWTVAAVNDAQVGIGSNGAGGGGNNVQVTKLWLTVDYIPQTGGFAYLIGQFVGPLIGAGILLKDMTKIAAATLRASGTILIKESEYCAAWRELRNDPHGVWLFL